MWQGRAGDLQSGKLCSSHSPDMISCCDKNPSPLHAPLIQRSTGCPLTQAQPCWHVPWGHTPHLQGTPPMRQQGLKGKGVDKKRSPHSHLHGGVVQSSAQLPLPTCSLRSRRHCLRWRVLSVFKPRQQRGLISCASPHFALWKHSW